MEFSDILCNEEASRHGEYNEKKMEFQSKQVTYHCMDNSVVRKDKKLARNSCTQCANSTSDKGNPLIMNGLL